MTPEDAHAPLDWRNVSGRNSRQLLRNVEHTTAVHAFLAALTGQARLLGWEVSQLDPPPRASRYFRHQDRMRSVNPDAFGVLRKGGTAWPFFLEWERRAVRPSTMSARLAPYLRYFSSHRPTDDHGVRPSVLVVFDDDIAQTHFLHVAREEMQAEEGRGAPVGLPPGGHRANGTAGTRLAHPRPVGVAPGAPAPLNHEKNGGSLGRPAAPAPIKEQEADKPCPHMTPTKGRDPGGAGDGPLSGSTRRPSGRGWPC